MFALRAVIGYLEGLFNQDHLKCVAPLQNPPKTYDGLKSDPENMILLIRNLGMLGSQYPSIPSMARHPLLARKAVKSCKSLGEGLNQYLPLKFIEAIRSDH